MQRLMMSMVLMTALSCGAVDLPSPIAWWKMDQIVEGKIPDASGNGRDLTVGEVCFLSNMTSTVCGLQVPTLYFQPLQGAVATFTCPALKTRTVVMDVYRDSVNYQLPDGGSIPYLLSNFSSLNVELRNTYNEVRPWFDSVQRPIQKPLPNQTWQQIAFVLEVTEEDASGTPLKGRLAYYQNAALTQEAVELTLPAKLAVEGTGYLGNNSSGMRPFYGHIGDTRIYDQALTPVQLAAIREESVRGKLLAQWNMDRLVTDGDDRYVEDGSGLGHKLYVGPAVTIEGGLDGKTLRFNPVSQETLNETWAYSELVCDTRAVTVSAWINVDSTLYETVAWGNDMPRVWTMEANNVRVGVHSDVCKDSTHYYTYLDYYMVGNAKWEYFNGMEERDHWTHLTVVSWIEGTTGYFDIYVNGKKISDTRSDEVGAMSFLTAAKPTFYLGAMSKATSSSNNRVLKGGFDDVRIYAGCLTEAQIRQVMRGPATVSVEDDFTVATETATLRASVGESAEALGRTGYSGEALWTLVSAPVGGEGVKILQPRSEQTQVSLPVEGVYTFKFACTSMGASNEGTVQVTRVAAASGNQPPTVTLQSAVTVPYQDKNALRATIADPDNQPGTLRCSWKKISGPGGVWFSPADAAATEVSFSAVGEYVLRCTVEDGQDFASADTTVTVTDDAAASAEGLASGLIAYFPFNTPNGLTVTNAVAGGANGTMSNYKTGSRTQHYEPTMDGLGYSGSGALDCVALDKSAFHEEVDSEGKLGKWLTMSAWVYHDATANQSGSISWNPSIIYKKSSFDLIYLTRPNEDDPTQDDGTRGFWIYQGLSSGGNTYAMPAKDPANRWMHVYLALDRQCDYTVGHDQSELWIDGVKQSPSAVGWGKGRINDNAIYIGGGNGYSSTKNHSEGRWYNSKDEPMSRHFPGIIDEVRVWNRKLTDSEIRYLATHPVMGNHRAPSVDGVPMEIKSVAKASLAVSVTAHGDGLAYDNSLTYEWLVLSGDAEKLVFADKTARSTTVTAKKKGSYVIQLKVFDGERTTYSDPIALDVGALGMALILR